MSAADSKVFLPTCVERKDWGMRAAIAGATAQLTSGV
jgi:hypothetical protein